MRAVTARAGDRTVAEVAVYRASILGPREREAATGELARGERRRLSAFGWAADAADECAIQAYWGRLVAADATDKCRELLRWACTSDRSSRRLSSASLWAFPLALPWTVCGSSEMDGGLRLKCASFHQPESEHVESVLDSTNPSGLFAKKKKENIGRASCTQWDHLNRPRLDGRAKLSRLPRSARLILLNLAYGDQVNAPRSPQKSRAGLIGITCLPSIRRKQKLNASQTYRTKHKTIHVVGAILSTVLAHRHDIGRRGFERLPASPWRRESSSCPCAHASRRGTVACVRASRRASARSLDAR